MCVDLCFNLTEKDIKQQAVDEMMQRIKNGVQLRRVTQTTNRARPGPVRFIKTQTKHSQPEYNLPYIFSTLTVLDFLFCTVKYCNEMKLLMIGDQLIKLLPINCLRSIRFFLKKFFI